MQSGNVSTMNFSLRSVLWTLHRYVETTYPVAFAL